MVAAVRMIGNNVMYCALLIPRGLARRRAGPVAAGLVLGVVALVPLAFLVIFVLRGVLYGIVDRGPYDNSWGGPSRAGAWFVHFLVGIPILLAGLGALAGIAALHRRLSVALDGGPRPRWLVPVTVAVVVFVVVFVVLWSRQI
ncbi:hypothetical protein [Dactylosporangium sp. NPDC049140]|uniref:hypothetical protein n=1 Tax=Dactylosporangium sp. NPDC049140 TaxID=3155647 RepID=UPI0033C66A13